MDALVSSTAGQIARAWLQMVAHLREENSVAAVASRLHTDTPVVGLLVAAAAFAGGQHAAYVRAGQVEARQLGDHFDAVQVRKKLPVFDAAAPSALAWAERNRLEKIREITTEQRALIHGTLVRGARAGTNPRAVAVELRDSIGLTTYQEQIVDNYRRQLESGQLAAARARELVDGRSDATIAAAIRANRPIPPERIDAMVEAYRRGVLRMRAETIARTEGLRVAHQASEELFAQAIERGDIRADQLVGTWHHSPRRADKRHERTFHRAMHGQTRAWGEPFESGLGARLRFPGDPMAPVRETANCACVVTWRIALARTA